MGRHQCLQPLLSAMAALVPLQQLLSLAAVAVADDAAGGGQGQPIGLPNCATSCGDVSVPYPFGVERQCRLGPMPDLHCNTSSMPPQLYLAMDTTQIVVNLSLDDSSIRLLWPSPYQGVPAPGVQYLGAQMLVEWAVGSRALQGPNETRAGNATCPQDLGTAACHSSYATCQGLPQLYDDYNYSAGYTCKCDEGYQGNPYLSNGCQDINECALPDKCFANCTNLPGTYLCQCPKGTIGDPYTRYGCVAEHHHLNKGLIIALGVGGGVIILFLVPSSTFIMHKIKTRRKKKMRQRFFKQNRGQLLQQLVCQRADIAEKMIVTLEELEKATNNFDKTRELGGGGHGMVYKGILSSLDVVAIKKSRIVIQREIDEFINEVAILSQINHRNIVKLLGCCLETEVPLLVYEFISNGTLFSHLHIEALVSLSWRDRLRIALETARALSYLHSLVSMPIIHRDVKSTNILLDNNLTVKLSDFGASRYVPVDQTGLDTTVQGTFGYLDPMYHSTGHLTEKSDVYSFGVILIELLTRKKPVSYRSSQGHGLVYHFVTLLSAGNISQILDPQVANEGGGEVVDIALLAAICVKDISKDRPAMRHVEMTLESIYAAKEYALSDDMTEESEESYIGAIDLSGGGISMDAAANQI